MLQLESKSDSVSIDIASNTVHMIDAGKKDKIGGPPLLLTALCTPLPALRLSFPLS